MSTFNILSQIDSFVREHEVEASREKDVNKLLQIYSCIGELKAIRKMVSDLVSRADDVTHTVKGRKVAEVNAINLAEARVALKLLMDRFDNISEGTVSEQVYVTHEGVSWGG